MGSSTNQMLKDVDLLRKQQLTNQNKLVEFTDEEMELLSTNYIDKCVKKRFTKTVSGTLVSIYGESLLNFSVKIYNDKQRIIIAQTSSDEFTYLTKSGKTHVFINQKEFGYINTTHQLVNTKNKLLANVVKDELMHNYVVYIDGKDCGHISTGEKTKGINPRAFNLMKEMTELEQLYFLSTGFHSIINEVIEA
jgi:hypothetical protein